MVSEADQSDMAARNAKDCQQHQKLREGAGPVHTLVWESQLPELSCLNLGHLELMLLCYGSSRKVKQWTEFNFLFLATHRNSFATLNEKPRGILRRLTIQLLA